MLYNNLLKIKKGSVLVIIAILFIVNVFSCKNIDNEYMSNIRDVSEERKTYILNENSKKIHISRCVSAHKISDKNRREVDDILSNLLSNGYSI